MNQIIDYQILTTTFANDLVEKVKEAIYQGWQPIGGVSVKPSPDPYIVYLMQSLIKYKN